MKKILIILLSLFVIGCTAEKKPEKKVPVAKLRIENEDCVGAITGWKIDVNINSGNYLYGCSTNINAGESQTFLLDKGFELVQEGTTKYVCSFTFTHCFEYDLYTPITTPLNFKDNCTTVIRFYQEKENDKIYCKYKYKIEKTF